MGDSSDSAVGNELEKVPVAIALGVAWSPAAAALPDLGHLVDFCRSAGLGTRRSLPTGRCVARSCITSTRTSASPNRMPLTMPGGTRANHAITAIDSPWFSMHLGFSAARVRFAEHMLPEGPTLERDELFPAHRFANVKRAKYMSPDRYSWRTSTTARRAPTSTSAIRRSSARSSKQPEPNCCWTSPTCKSRRAGAERTPSRCSTRCR